MSKKEFEGNIIKKSPQSIINIESSTNRDLENFFLILGLIFNDLKGLLFFSRIIEENYRKPELDEVNFHSGEYNGLKLQIDKLIISTVGEFFRFLEKNQSTIGGIRFKLILKKLDSSNRKKWEDLVKIEQGATILSRIAQVRSNVAFHYDHSMKNLRNGFIKSFFSDDKKQKHYDKACYSFGETMEKSRIFFSDAAEQGYINSILDFKDQLKIREAVSDLNHVLYSLLRSYYSK